MYSSLLQWGRGALSYSTDKIITFPISFINFRKIVAMHYGDMTTVNVIEDMDYRTNLTSTLLKYASSNVNKMAVSVFCVGI